MNSLAVEISKGLFDGCAAFTHVESAESNDWLVFSNQPFSEPPKIAPSNQHVHLFHGTTLSQCCDILRDGFVVGLHREGSVNHPSGIYGTDHPGHSFDRVPLTRGWSHGRESSICGWDAPVALCWKLSRDSLKRCGDLRTGTIYCFRAPRYSRVQITGDLRTQIWFHKEIYERFRSMPAVWADLIIGTKVACRAKTKEPQVLYNSGSASPMCCGRVVALEDAKQNGWHKAINSHQWICKNCSIACNLCMPSTSFCGRL